MSLAPTLLRLSGLSDDEENEVEFLTARLMSHRASNRDKDLYYEAEREVQHMGIAVPPEVARRIEPVVGWASTVVDVLEERLDWYGWTETGDGLGLDKVFADNSLDVESSPAHLDALLYGVSFARVGHGAADEPEVLVTTHSPMDMTGVWSQTQRRLTSALAVLERDEDGPVAVSLDLPDETLILSRSNTFNTWRVRDRIEHRLGRVPVARLTNRPRGARREGKSEITKAVRYYCDAAVRTALGMEANREFYGIPQLTLLGRGPDAFMDTSGNPTSGWKIVAGHALAIDRDDDGQVPDVKQLQVGSPQPFLEQLKGWAQLLATEAGLPVTYLGFQSDNPASADAIRAMESRLVKRAERRQTAFGRAWMEAARLALLVRDGEVPEDLHERVSMDWREASTPTRAATADETVKYVGAGVLPAESDVTRSRMGLTPAEKRRLDDDARRHAGRSVIESLMAGPSAAQAEGEDADAIAKKANALGQLIRAGVSPESAAAQVGLSGLDFTGEAPVYRLEDR